ncbi:MAG: DNA-binding response regulator [Chloroflexi bacterium]|nr:MAG: DNA-binding response regulator [Chloroflexota bacterium]
MTPIRILLVDDHTLFREGIRRLVNEQPNMKIVAEAATGRQAVDRAIEFNPDVILMDIAMPDMTGLQATKVIREQLPQTRILLLTVHDDREYLFHGLEAGASGYVLKEAEAQALVMAIQAVHRGEIYLYPSVTRWLVQDYLQRGTRANAEEQQRLTELTDRQQTVLQLLAEGCSNQDIAAELVLSPYTVQTHIQNIMKKLNLHNRAELIKYAIRYGLTDLTPPD